MKYEPKLRSRERILVFGPAGSGKSQACYDVACTIPGRVFVVDNDYSWERMIETDPSGGGDMQLQLDDIYHDDWKQLIAATEQAVKDGTKDDLLVVDSMSPTWQAVQDYFTDEVFGQESDAYFLQVRKQQGDKGSNLEAFDGWKDWSVINKLYGRLYRNLARFPGHVMLTAELDTLAGGDDKDMKGIFGPYRAKPRGQKRLAHTVNTIVMLGKERAGEFTMTVCKDRGREKDETIERETWANFANDFMVGVAGWTPARTPNGEGA
jgi:hypothetical protein